MDLTRSYMDVVPDQTLARYTWMETRNAAAVLSASNPAEFDDLMGVLEEFALYDSDLLLKGGNRGPVSIRIDKAFEERGWRAVRIDMRTELLGRSKPSSHVRGPYLDEFLRSTVSNNGYEVDNMKRRVAVDVEWNGKDGALDRDTGAYRALYELGLIDVAAIVTRHFESIRSMARDDLSSEDAYRRLGTRTGTNMEKLQDRMVRGDAGGCPLLAVGIHRQTWAGPGSAAPSLTLSEVAASLQRDDDDSASS